MNRIFILILLITNASHLNAQNQFYRIGDSTGVFNLVSSVRQNMEGEFVGLCNYPDTTSHLRSGFVKMNQTGDTILTKLYSAPISFLPGTVEQTNDSGYIFSCFHTTGSTTSYGIVLIRTNKDGNVIWSKGYGDTLMIRIGGVKCKSFFGNGFIISTTHLNNVTQTAMATLLRVNDNGDTLWTKSYSNTGESFDLQITSDSGFILIGNSYLLKTDSSGNFIWGRKYSGLFSLTHSIAELNDRGFIFSYNDGYEIHVVKVDSVGDFQWGKSYGTNNNNEYVFKLNTTIDGGIIVAGGYQLGKVLVIKMNNFGDTLWVKAYGDSNYQGNAYDIAQTSDGGFLIGGSVQNSPGFDSKSLIIKTDSMGETSCSNYNYPLDVNSFTLLDTVLDVTDISGFTIKPESIIVESEITFSSPCQTTSINEMVEESLIDIYPNPSHGIITIKRIDANATFDLSIYNSFGSLIRIEKNLSSNNILNLEKFQPGLYFLVIRIGQKNYFKKIVIE